MSATMIGAPSETAMTSQNIHRTSGSSGSNRLTVI